MDVYSIITERTNREAGAGHDPVAQAVAEHRSAAQPRIEEGLSRRECLVAPAQGCKSPYWATIWQINEFGGHVRKGEKASPVVFRLIYMDGFEVNSNGEEREPEHEQPEGQGRRRVCPTLLFSFQY